MSALAQGRPDLRTLPRETWAGVLSAHFAAGLPGLLGLEILEVEPGWAEARLELRDEVLQTAGEHVHGGTVVSFADSCVGWGCMATLPPAASGFTTVELNASFVASATVPDALRCRARLLHGGRSTQVWDASVTRERDDRAIAHLRATQYLLAGAT